MLYLLIILVFQYKQEKHELQKTLNNIDQEYRTMKNDYLRKEMLRNKSRECDALKDHLKSLERKQKGCYGEAKLVLDCEQRSGTEGIFNKKLH